MKKKNNKIVGITRRQFVKQGIGVSLAAATAGCTSLGIRKPAGESNEFDYIVVGSGAGGGPVAANLAKAGFTVLIIEAGSNFQTQNYDVPAFHPKSTEDPGMCWNFLSITIRIQSGSGRIRNSTSAATASSIRVPERSAAVPLTTP